MYGSTSNKNKVRQSRKILNDLYAFMPETKGCMKHINLPKSDGGCGGWCCFLQDPQVLYAEFLNTWSYISDNWDNEDILNLIEDCIRRYVFTFKKGCVFWDQSTKLCKQHQTRPYNCRVYGIIPDEEFKPRFERLKILNPQTKYQCSLVETADGREVTTKDTDLWWNIAKSAEKKLGIHENLIHDGQEGSYRRYHEHVLIHVFGEEAMMDLSTVRESKDMKYKEKTVRAIIKNIKNLNEAKNDKEQSQDS